MDTIWIIRMGLSLVNLSLLLIFIYIFTKKHAKLRSEITLGFLLFTIALFMRTFFASPLLKIPFGIVTASIVDPYRIIADLFELAALLTLLFILEK
jgi:hypothetical protein